MWLTRVTTDDGDEPKRIGRHSTTRGAGNILPVPTTAAPHRRQIDVGRGSNVHPPMHGDWLVPTPGTFGRILRTQRRTALGPDARVLAWCARPGHITSGAQM